MNYNNKWLIEKYKQDRKIRFLFFWGHQPNKNGSIGKTCFSQWWVAPFKVDGIIYSTAEHWMMAGKARLFNDEAAFEKIIHCKTPAEAKKAGRAVEGFEPTLWDENKFDIVIAGNMHKFSQHNALGDFLLATGDSVLVEASPVDEIWGIKMSIDNPTIENPLTWKGENLLGYALMKVRDKLNGHEH